MIFVYWDPTPPKKLVFRPFFQSLWIFFVIGRHVMPTLVQFCPIFYMYWRAWHYMTALLLLMQQFLCQPITALDYMFHSMRAQQITVHFSYLATVEQKKSRSTDNCFLRLCRAPRGLQGSTAWTPYPQPSAGARRTVLYCTVLYGTALFTTNCLQNERFSVLCSLSVVSDHSIMCPYHVPTLVLSSTSSMNHLPRRAPN